MKQNRKIILAFFLGMYFVKTAFSQHKVLITAQLRDSVTTKPIVSGEVVQVSMNDKSLSKTLINAPDGAFSFLLDTSKTAKIYVSSIGYFTKNLLVKNTIHTGKILVVTLTPISYTINEIKIVAKKNHVDFVDDKIVYSVANDSLNRGRTGLEALSNVPLIDVSADNKIMLRGGYDYKVTIDGRSSGMANVNAANFLKNMPSNTIEKIEILLDPAYKYKQDGVNYIINVITNKKNWDSYYGSFSGQINNVGYEIGASLQTKLNKVAFMSNINFSDNQMPASFLTWESTYFRQTKMVSRIYQEGSRINKNKFLNADIQFSYDIDSLNLINASFTTSLPTLYTQSSYNIQAYDAQNMYAGLPYTSNINGKSVNGFFIGNMDYEKRLRNAKGALSLSAQWFNRINEVENQISIPQKNYSYQNPVLGQSNEYTLQVDLLRNLPKKIKIETGLKTIGRHIMSGDFENKLKLIDFNQYITTLYTSVNFKLAKYSMRIGGQLDYTSNNAQFSANTLNNTYTNILPRLSISKNLSKKRSFSLLYNSRIRRPSVYQMNPGLNLAIPNFTSFGNPTLTPEYIQNITFNYNTFLLKKVLSTALYFQQSTNSIDMIRFIGVDSVLSSTYSNIGRSHTSGINAYYSFSFLKKATLKINSDVSLYSITSTINNQSNSNINYKLFFTLSFKLPHKINISCYNFLYSRQISFQGYSSRTSDIQLMMTKNEFLHKNINLKLIAIQPFRKHFVITSYYRDNYFQQQSLSNNFVQYFGVQLGYDFGDSEKSLFSLRRKGISNDDTK